MKKLAWLPAVLAPVVVAGVVASPSLASAAAVSSTSSSAATGTPSAASVLASVAKSTDTAFSGKLTQTSDLGLPTLPSAASGTGASSAESGAADVLDLLTSSHTARVYVNGADKSRVQVLDTLAERDVVRNGTTLWTWDSKSQRAAHVTLPSRSSADTSGTVTPSTLAKRALAAIRPGTHVSKPVTTTVAGRSAWTIVLTPKSDSTLVHDVSIAVDKATGLPLSAAIDAKGQSAPAFAVAYSTIDFHAPSAKLFTFTPPSGAKVTTVDLAARSSQNAHTHRGTGFTQPTTTGSGWSTIAELPAGTFQAPKSGADGSRLFRELTTSVDGGHALQTSLVSVYITKDGRLLAGAVPVADLVAAAK